MEGFLVGFPGANVVASSKGVAGVKTHAEAVRKAGAFKKRCNLLKTAPDTGPLPRRGLKKDAHFRRAGLFHGRIKIQRNGPKPRFHA